MTACDTRGAPGQAQPRVVARALGHHAALGDHAQPLGAQAQRLDRVAGIQHDERGGAARRDAIALEPDDPGVARRHHLEAARHLGRRRHLRHMQPHEGHVEHVGGAQRIPRVEHAILAPADLDPLRQHLLDPGQAAPLREAVVAPLQHDVDQRVRDRRDARLGDQRQKLGHIVIVHRMHRGQVAADGPALQPGADDLIGQRLDVAAHRVVGLVAMQVDRQPAPGRDRAQIAHRGRALGHRAFEMRDAADHVDAHVERADQIFAPARGAVEPVLREGDQLQVEPVFHLFPNLQKRLNRAQRGVGGVDMRADRQKPHRGRPVTIGERALDHLLDRRLGAQLAPERDPLEQRARGVDPRRAIAERGIKVEMRVDEGRRHQAAGGVDHPACLGLDPADGGDGAALDADVRLPPVGQHAPLHQDVEAHLSPLLNGTISAAGTLARRDMTTSARIDRR
ncbi:hypothetical protein SDC9_39032 [bioreactor metagenome]|uniref:Uncharacterized protein n=1 Tax=bioreactor metagenome TaxID=1076179 RepID=A0A644VNF9_9ZZZZ